MAKTIFVKRAVIDELQLSQNLAVKSQELTLDYADYEVSRVRPFSCILSKGLSG